MNGTGRKCLIASAVTHGLLLVMLFVGSAFIPNHRPPEPIAITLIEIPDFLIDEPNMVGGGNPRAGIPEPQPQAPPAQATPATPVNQPLPEPEPPKPQPQAAPQVRQPVLPEPRFNFSETKRPAERPPRTQPAFDFSKARRKTIQPSKAPNGGDRAARESAAAREKQLARAAGTALSRLQSGLSTGVGEIGVPGPGGPAYMSYNLALRKFYEDAWIPPQVSRDNEPLVEVEVTIARDGTVLNARILKRSGRRELDQSVDRTLKRVKKVPPFPSGSKDEKRTFKINFNLSSKLNLG